MDGRALCRWVVEDRTVTAFGDVAGAGAEPAEPGGMDGRASTRGVVEDGTGTASGVDVSSAPEDVAGAGAEPGEPGGEGTRVA